MTDAETRNHQPEKLQNGEATAITSTAEDVFDDMYREKDGPKPAMRLVWRNIILMSVLHAGALYGLMLLPSAMPLTFVWSEYFTVKSKALPLCRVYFSPCLAPLPTENIMCSCCATCKLQLPLNLRAGAGEGEVGRGGPRCFCAWGMAETPEQNESPFWIGLAMFYFKPADVIWPTLKKRES